MVFKYNVFVGEKSVNENIQQSKKFLKDRYVLGKVAKSLNLITGKLQSEMEGGKKTILLSDFAPADQEAIKLKIREVKLTDEEVRTIERDPDFIKVRELLKDNPGWTYIFVYFYFVEGVPMDELKDIYDKLIEFNQL